MAIQAGGREPRPWSSARAWVCMVNGQVMSSSVGPAIRAQVYGRMMREHLVKKDRLTNTTFAWVNWEALGWSLMMKSQLFCLWASKFASRFCGTNKMLHITKQHQDPQCPCCEQEGSVEDTVHVLLCPDPRMSEYYDQRAQDLQQWLDHTTSPDIAQILGQYIRRRGEQCPIHEMNALIAVAGQQQNQIGWANFMEGKVSRAWEDCQGALSVPNVPMMQNMELVQKLGLKAARDDSCSVAQAQ